MSRKLRLTKRAAADLLDSFSKTLHIHFIVSILTKKSVNYPRADAACFCVIFFFDSKEQETESVLLIVNSHNPLGQDRTRADIVVHKTDIIPRPPDRIHPNLVEHGPDDSPSENLCFPCFASNSWTKNALGSPPTRVCLLLSSPAHALILFESTHHAKSTDKLCYCYTPPQPEKLKNKKANTTETKYEKKRQVCHSIRHGIAYLTPIYTIPPVPHQAKLQSKRTPSKAGTDY